MENQSANRLEAAMVSTTTTTTMAPETTTASAETALPDTVLATLYHRYSIKQRRAGLECFLAASILFDLWAIFVPQGQSWDSVGVTLAFLFLNILLVVFLRGFGTSRFREVIYEVTPHIAWLIAINQIFLQLFNKGVVTPRDSLAWAILLNFFVYVTLPVPLKYAGMLLGFGSFIAHMNTTIVLPKREEYFIQQQITNALLLGSAAAMGLMCYFLGEAKHRRAFLEAKQSLEVKMVIEEQSDEQERLLLSVLPEHVAVKMRQDLGSDDTEQFKKIYMSRHENVSILYADIVGFTAISSTYSAQDLVKMLNELFARFDRLAEKYHQLRIKILGDCYYCISGAPIERPDHAVLCVHMGLSMVKAIKYVQAKTNSPVDMRVGIHTGAILAGILGQRQWQFDVYSRDVELANKMESSGLAGRVHISEKTLSFMDGEFEIEPAFGEKREESLRIAGLKTYFIKKVLVPFVADVSGHMNGASKIDTAESLDSDDPSIMSKENDPKPPNDKAIEDSISDKEEVFKQRFKMELLSRDRHGELSKETTIFLNFKSHDLETAYNAHRQPLSSVPLIATLLVYLVGAIYSSIVLPSSFVRFVFIVSPLSVLTVLVVVSVAESFPDIFPAIVLRASTTFNDMVMLRRLTAISIVLSVGFINALDMLTCAQATEEPTVLKSARNGSSSTMDTTMQDTTAEATVSLLASTVCTHFPSYFSNYSVLILIATAVITQLSHVCKICLMVIIAGVHCGVNVYQLDESFRVEEYHSWNQHLSICYTLSAALIAVTFALSFLARHMDKEDRVIFKWKNEVNEQKEKAGDMRRRNEALVYNILPVHVAKHFMTSKTRSYDELYSQSYEEVGVLFASMPNFSDFYSEDTVNNQGLECLRFLNEVISDFDALLEIQKFQDIIKIKTIGSTYMAASGLNPSRQVKPKDPIIIRWEHLSLLVEFALELKKALQCINEQSFNHFVLKMGINHGPITAGVIGARKPHYDIWGNTVNVASRMESTGKAGAVQVTEETCGILQAFGYTFEQRGLVAVKGKGQLMTYYLQGRTVAVPPSSIHSSNVSGNQNSLETLAEVDETKETTSSIELKARLDQPAITDASSASTATTTSPNSVKAQPPTSLSISVNNHSINNVTTSEKSLSSTSAGVTHNNQVDTATISNFHVASNCSSSSAVTAVINTTTNETSVAASDDAEATEPLLVDGAKNSTNSNTNDYSGSEKDALIMNSSN